MPEPVRRFLGVAVERWHLVLRFLLDRAREPGSIRQVTIAFCALIGVQMAPDRVEAIGWIGLGLAVLVGILTTENPAPPPAPPEQPKDDQA
jgi:hypothetical protein